MTYKTYTKKFIREFDFDLPLWEKLPSDFPNLPIEGLDQEERYLLDAMKFAFFANEAGRQIITRRVLRTSAFVLIICLMGLIGLIKITSPAGEMFSRPVNAATVSASLKTVTQQADEVVQSTMSAIMRR